MISCQLKDIQISDYFLAASYANREQALIKVGATETRFLRNGTSPEPVLPAEENGWKLIFPYRFACVHEAGHFLYSLIHLQGAHVADGITFFPYAPGSGGLTGSWHDPSPGQKAQQCLAGIICQLCYDPDSFEKPFREAIAYSTIFSNDHPFDEKISAQDKKYMAGAETDYREIWEAGQAQGANAVMFLREQELIVKARIKNVEFHEKVEKIVSAVPEWFSGQGRTSWENGILYSPFAFIPRSEILKFIA